MTTRDLGQDPGQDLGDDLGQGLVRDSRLYSTSEIETDENALGALFESSPARIVQTSAAAEIAFLAGTVAVLSAPFSLMLGACVALSLVGLVSSVIGLARASRPNMAGGLLASIGLVLCLATLAIVALRYAGIDTAVGDAALPTFTDWLTGLNALVPAP
jgi:hypothetical protein